MAWILWTVAWTVIAYEMAKKRGRNPNYAIAGGLLFGVFAVLYYWIAGDSRELKKQKLMAEIGKDATLI
jgi:hypothetical protein